ncbi:hypothetical protein CLOSPI_00414 [Thomasclavelia spiroformis DSM 1552]|uniref:Uncharacterized protein n=1 Tax=Thomasclavelia spiroformis DSM 1552 TaxID=428126 RepID=B1BZ42_9FIRM|nr:hypothetical protein CLOSPI_01561 [Thomasclavelia spiroformis DSM 1552]EDS75296.1 hypothetical protein CLOSPI_00690 [Thomasclavelia spiroformis DSM 1552]EDS75413.1 hypothetical protein CLOSPI_00807 [Thomasclavelia spiroformis DSM 1552]EDS75689.1 hypothetical protein CLOSPI_00199 [Thomasclavelia spiroformis DSM 1552]EDS75758.1 hypothetical protein CLOSPI_00277 [Thomasclavelia spiroformis DSM 1552]
MLDTVYLDKKQSYPYLDNFFGTIKTSCAFYMFLFSFLGN